MEKIKKSLKLVTVFITVIAFCLTFIYIPADNSLYAASAKIKVCIDAGHGGSDPGAVRFGLNEKDANLDIALRLKSKLEANGFEVIMTRTRDTSSSLDERVNKANSSGVDIFLSIHNNAALTEYAHGTETYWCANGVNGSSQFASLVQSNLVKQIGRANRGVKTADFKVIKYTKMPAALVECAFVSNPTEAELLKTSNFKEKCAVGLYNAIVEFSKGIKKSSGSSGSSSSDKTGSTGSIITTSGREFSEFTIKVLGLEPANDSVVTENFKIIGWSADIKNSPPIELKKVEFYKGPERNKSNLLGTNKSFQYNILGSTGIINGGWEETIEISMLDEGENITYVYAYDKNDNYSIANVKINVIKNGDTV
ncbi:MAG: N-acetylmuramoyl-L-alanine amidase, partial [Actinomycetota bacterium]|nr:N-acetylmuramoyl-L-alanine amidase [Actinomycetota bacterium]